MNKLDAFVYVGGHYTNNITYQLFSTVAKIDARTMSISSMGGFAETPSIHASTVSFLSLVHVPGSGFYTDVIFAVHEPLVRDDTYSSPELLKITQLASRSDTVGISLQKSTTVPKLNTVSHSQSYRCTGLQAIDQNTVAIMFTDPYQGEAYYGTVDFSVTSASAILKHRLVKVFGQFSSLVNHGKYKSISSTSGHWYYVGSAFRIQ